MTSKDIDLTDPKYRDIIKDIYKLRGSEPMTIGELKTEVSSRVMTLSEKLAEIKEV